MDTTWDKTRSLTAIKAPVLSKGELEMARLGKSLFFDKRISANGEVACISCHRPGRYFTDGLTTAKAIGVGKRNTPTVVNSFALSWSFWDGRADSIASQAVKPIEDSIEHGSNRVQVFRLLEANYRKEYESIWGSFPVLKSNIEHGLPSQEAPIIANNIKKILASKPRAVPRHRPKNKNLAAKKLLISKAKWQNQFDGLAPSDQDSINKVFARTGIALAQFERTIVSSDSPFDKFMKRWGKPAASGQAFDKSFGPQEYAGLQVFVGKGGCINCHHGSNFSDRQFHNVGFPNDGLDLGRAAGLAALKQDIFNCDNKEMKGQEWLQKTSSCEEKPYLNYAAVDSIGAFKTPSLRNVAMTAPYGHNGQLPTLRAVIENYQNPQSKLGHVSESLPKMALNESEKKALEAFLLSLTGKFSHL